LTSSAVLRRFVEESEDRTNGSAGSTTKRLLYPVGRIYHLVPGYILKSEAEDSCSEEQPPISGDEQDW